MVLSFGLQDSPYLVMAEAAGAAFFDQDDLGPPALIQTPEVREFL